MANQSNVIKTKAYLHSSKECMYDLGVKIGLTGEALDTFCYALYEVEIHLEVDRKTGKAKILKATQ